MPKNIGKTGEQFISEIVAKGTDGYLVKVPNENNVYVSTNKEGSKEKALKKAVEIRNEILDRINYKHKFAEGKKTKNKTGIVGVREVLKSRKHKNGKEYFSWVFIATGKCIKGKLQQKTFFVVTYGRKKARELAIQQRQEYLKNY